MVKGRFAIGKFAIEAGVTSGKIFVESVREIWDSFPKFIINLLIAFIVWTIGGYLFLKFAPFQDFYGVSAFQTIGAILLVVICILLSKALSEIRDMAEAASGLLTVVTADEEFERKLRNYNFYLRTLCLLTFLAIFTFFILTLGQGEGEGLGLFSGLALVFLVVIILVHTFVPAETINKIGGVVYGPMDAFSQQQQIIAVVAFVGLALVVVGMFYSFAANVVTDKDCVPGIDPSKLAPEDQDKACGVDEFCYDKDRKCRKKVSGERLVFSTFGFSLFMLLAALFVDRIVTNLADEICRHTEIPDVLQDEEEGSGGADEIADYISKCKDQGMPMDKIRSSLLDAGFTEANIAKYFPKK